LKDQRVAPEQLVLFRLDLCRKPVARGRVPFFGLLSEILGIENGQEISTARNRIEAHSIEIGNDDFVTGSRKYRARVPSHRAVEALWLGVGVDDEDAHRMTALKIDLRRLPSVMP